MNIINLLIDICFITCYYGCYRKAVKALDNEFKILNEMDKNTDLNIHKKQTIKTGIYLVLVILAFLGLLGLNVMVTNRILYENLGRLP